MDDPIHLFELPGIQFRQRQTQIIRDGSLRGHGTPIRQFLKGIGIGKRHHSNLFWFPVPFGDNGLQRVRTFHRSTRES